MVFLLCPGLLTGPTKGKGVVAVNANDQGGGGEDKNFKYRDKLFGCDGNLKRLSVSREGVGSDYPTE